MIIAQNVEMNKAKLLSQLEILSTLFTDDYIKMIAIAMMALIILSDMSLVLNILK